MGNRKRGDICERPEESIINNERLTIAHESVDWSGHIYTPSPDLDSIFGNRADVAELVNSTKYWNGKTVH